MRVSVYLHRYISDVLKTFGELNDVINRILEACEDGSIDVYDKPECENRNDAFRYEVNVTNEYYLSLMSIHGSRSKNISLRRLLYWFVDNEIYNDLEWEPIREYMDADQIKINKLVDNVIIQLDKLLFHMDNDGTLTHAKDLILSFKR